MSAVFDKSNHVLCTRHLQLNLVKNMKNKGMSDKEVGRLRDDLNALVTANSEPEFEFLQQKICDKHFNGTNDNYVMNTMEKLRQCVWSVSQTVEYVPINFKTNHNESMNNLLKYYTDHEPKPLKSVVDIVTNIQKIQHEDILSAFYGEGNYELSKERLNYRVSKGAWLKMSEKDRKDYYKKLITGVKKPKKIVQSSDGEVQLEEAHVRMKPGQRRGPRREPQTTVHLPYFQDRTAAEITLVHF